MYTVNIEYVYSVQCTRYVYYSIHFPLYATL